MEAGDEGIEIVDSKDLQQQSKAFNKLTDHAMASIAASREADIQAMRMREKELAAVKINAADVDIIANELETFNPVSGRTSVRKSDDDGVAATELAAGGVQVPPDGRGAHHSLSEAENQWLEG
nr:huntingtin-interacting protein K isoform X1 [Ipomoea trifida]